MAIKKSYNIYLFCVYMSHGTDFLLRLVPLILKCVTGRKPSADSDYYKIRMKFF